MTTYSKEIAVAICEQLAEGKSLRKICAQEGYPHESTVRMWVRDDYEGFSTQYARAREIGYELLADEILEISDDSSGDVRITEDGREILDSERVARSRLRVDSRKWMLSKMLPKIYGEKLELASDPKNPLLAGITVNFVKPDGKPA
jgi:hypothetical protein